jgi:hypothetical protein
MQSPEFKPQNSKTNKSNSHMAQAVNIISYYYRCLQKVGFEVTGFESTTKALTQYQIAS